MTQCCNVVDGEWLPSDELGVRDKSFSVYYVPVNSCEKCAVDIICKI